MSHVLVLISNPVERAVTRQRRMAVADALELAMTGFDELSPDTAYDMALPADAVADAGRRARTALDGAPVDVAIVPVANRRKAVFLADMDSTMIEQECIDEIGAIKGLRAPIAAITERAMRGEIAFEEALRERVALLQGVSRAEIGELIASRLTLTPGARTAVRTMRAHGTYCVLVSGGFSVFTSAIAARIGFDENRANTLLFDEDRLSGAVAEPILGQDAKLQALVSTARARGIAMAASMAVGDGANDLAMIQAAGFGVAYHAKPVVAQKAGIRIDHGDLTALLYVQGYSQEQFSS